MGAPGEMNLFVSFECLNQFSFKRFESYFKRDVIQDWIREISSKRLREKLNQ